MTTESPERWVERVSLALGCYGDDDKPHDSDTAVRAVENLKRRAELAGESDNLRWAVKKLSRERDEARAERDQASKLLLDLSERITSPDSKVQEAHLALRALVETLKQLGVRR